MSSRDEECTLCNKKFSSLGEDGCEDCGLDYDPLQPDPNVPLDFNKYEREHGALPLSAPWDGEDE